MTTVRTLFVAVALVLAVAGCTGPGTAASPVASPGGTGVGQGGIGGIATAGPVCPVERVPPDPKCVPRPVAGAVVVVRDGAGREVARATTAADGRFFVAVPPGTYVVSHSRSTA